MSVFPLTLPTMAMATLTGHTSSSVPAANMHTDLCVHPAIDEVLQGTYIMPPHATQATKDFLQACKAPDSLENTLTGQLLRTCIENQVWRWKCTA